MRNVFRGPGTPTNEKGEELLSGNARTYKVKLPYLARLGLGARGLLYMLQMPCMLYMLYLL